MTLTAKQLRQIQAVATRYVLAGGGMVPTEDETWDSFSGEAVRLVADIDAPLDAIEGLGLSPELQQKIKSLVFDVQEAESNGSFIFGVAVGLMMGGAR